MHCAHSLRTELVGIGQMAALGGMEIGGILVTVIL